MLRHLEVQERGQPIGRNVTHALDNLPLLATPKQVAEATGLSSYQVRTLLRDGRLPHVQIGSRPMISRDGLARFLAESTVQTCREETQGHVSASWKSVAPITSSGQSRAQPGVQHGHGRSRAS